MTRAGLFFSTLFLLLFLSGCGGRGIETGPLLLQPTTFAALSGWADDHQLEALMAFQNSCRVFEKKSPQRAFVIKEAGQIKDWLPACDKALYADIKTDAQARAFFEKAFTPHVTISPKEGLFTGYYKIQLRGSLEKGGSYQTPLWAKPDDLLSLDLGAFRPDLYNIKLVGKIKGSKFVPYDKREQIARASLQGRAKPLVWVDDPVRAFFMEVQGSGEVLLPDGKTIHLGFAAQNGHPYTAIGRTLLDQGELERPVSMSKIEAWLHDHPERAQKIMDMNESFVFFAKQDKAEAIGAMGVPLTPMRSMAVDRSFIPLGVLLWLETPDKHLLTVAQDTGGAIKGPVRGDLFWGIGDVAEQGAGAMQDKGTYYLLLPKKRIEP